MGRGLASFFPTAVLHGDEYPDPGEQEVFVADCGVDRAFCSPIPMTALPADDPLVARFRECYRDKPNGLTPAQKFALAKVVAKHAERLPPDLVTSTQAAAVLFIYRSHGLEDEPIVGPPDCGTQVLDCGMGPRRTIGSRKVVRESIGWGFVPAGGDRPIVWDDWPPFKKRDWYQPALDAVLDDETWLLAPMTIPPPPVRPGDAIWHPPLYDEKALERMAHDDDPAKRHIAQFDLGVLAFARGDEEQGRTWAERAANGFDDAFPQASVDLRVSLQELKARSNGALGDPCSPPQSTSGHKP